MTRLALYGLAGAALLGAATWAWLTVSGWHSDSERLPVVERQRDAALATVKLAWRTNGCGRKLEAIQTAIRSRVTRIFSRRRQC